MSPHHCGCGAEVIPGALWTPADALTWAHEHEGHGAPEASPRAMRGELPVADARELPAADARELRTALRGAYVVGVTTYPDGKPRMVAR